MKTKIVRWDITGMCNLSCMHCYNRMPRKSELSTKSIITILQILLNNGLHELNLSGREPTMRTDLQEIVNWCHLNDVRVNLTTNGVLLDRKRIAELAQFVNMIVYSIDGPNCSVHDAIRGKGSFKKTIANIKQCGEFIKHNQINLKLGVSCTINRINYLYTADMIDLCSSLDVAFLSVNPTNFFGSASSARAALYLSPSEIIDVWEHLCRRYNMVEHSFDLYLGTLPMEARMLNVKYNLGLPVIQNGCTAGSSLYIDPYGGAFPCYMIPPIAQTVPEFSRYNKPWKILTQPISSASREFSAFIELTRKHIREENVRCKGCEYIINCKPCPLILLFDKTANERCKLAQSRLARILSKIDYAEIPILKRYVRWDLNGDRLVTKFHRGDYSSEKEFRVNPRARAIFLAIDGVTTLADIRTKVLKEYRLISSSKFDVDSDIKEFVNYLRKEGIVEMKRND